MDSREIRPTTVEIAESFLDYCKLHPEYRFWQAVRNFTNHHFILTSLIGDPKRDTFYITNDEVQELRGK